MDVTVKTATKILAEIVRNQMDGGDTLSTMLWGAPGVGKSSIVKSLALEYGLDFRDVRLAEMDPVDMRGVPWVSDDGRTRWAVPAFLPCDKASRGILLLDEISAAEPSIQVAAYQLVLDRRIGEYKLPDKWCIIAAGNRIEDHAVAMPMSSALANRFMHLELRVEPEEWAHWAAQNGLNSDLIGFIRLRPEMLFNMKEGGERTWPSPRSWENVSRILKMNMDEPDLAACISGLVGDCAAMQFIAYRKKCKKLGDVRSLMLDNSLQVPSCSQGDICFAFASALAYWVWRGQDEMESEKLLDGFFRITSLLPSAYAKLAMIDAMESARDDSKVNLLMEHPGFAAWQARCGAA